MAWLMWVKDPVLREFAIQAGGGSFFANFTGNPAQLGNKFYNYNGLGMGQGQLGQYTNGQLSGGEVSHPESGNYQQMTSAPMLPNYLGIPFRILVSPFINFDPDTRTTDVLMFNSKNLGAPDRRGRPARQELGGRPVQHEPHVDRRDLRLRHPQRGSGHRDRQEREDPSERVHHAGAQRVQPLRGQQHLHRPGLSLIEASKPLTRAPIRILPHQLRLNPDASTRPLRKT